MAPHKSEWVDHPTDTQHVRDSIRQTAASPRWVMREWWEGCQTFDRIVGWPLGEDWIGTGVLQCRKGPVSVFTAERRKPWQLFGQGWCVVDSLDDSEIVLGRFAGICDSSRFSTFKWRQETGDHRQWQLFGRESDKCMINHCLWPRTENMQVNMKIMHMSLVTMSTLKRSSLIISLTRATKTPFSCPILSQQQQKWFKPTRSWRQPSPHTRKPDVSWARSIELVVSGQSARENPKDQRVSRRVVSLGLSNRKSLHQRILESNCRICGQKGHWKSECPNRGQSMPGSSASTAPVTLSLGVESMDCQWCVSRWVPEPAGSTAPCRGLPCRTRILSCTACFFRHNHQPQARPIHQHEGC